VINPKPESVLYVGVKLQRNSISPGSNINIEIEPGTIDAWITALQKVKPYAKAVSKHLLDLRFDTAIRAGENAALLKARLEGRVGDAALLKN
jgi:hypothetical protein